MRSLLNAVFPEGNKISFIFFQPCVVTISRNSNLTIFVTTLTGYIFRFMGEGGVDVEEAWQAPTYLGHRVSNEL